MKKFLMLTTILFATIALSTSYSFANNSAMEQMRNSVRNVVGGTENVVEGAAKNGSNAIKGGFNTMGNMTNSAVHGTTNAFNNNTTAYYPTNHRDGYTATRTATNTTFAGMNGTVWTWLIIGVAAIAVIGFIWYYAMQKTSEPTKRD